MQVLEQALVEAPFAGFAIEALEATVLHWAPRLDQHVADAMRLRPGHGCPAGEIRFLTR